MELKDVASVSGKGGLFKVLKPGNTGVLLESLDSAKAKLVVGPSAKISMLSEVSIYTTTKEGTVPLEDVLRKIKTEFKDDLGIDANADPVELKAFMKSVLAEYDENRVYVSDIKKLVKWYGVLLQFAPEVFEKPLEPKEKKDTKSDQPAKSQKKVTAKKNK